MAAPRIVLSLALLAAAALVAFMPGGDERLPARPVAQSANGSLSVWNTRAGEAILRADRLAPGDAASGLVTIGNAGTVAGFFALAQAGLQDAPGPGGGRLSDGLDLVITDVSRPDAPQAVYSGKLGAMTSQPLGVMQPGEARSFRFTATLPEGQTTLGAAGDNAFAGSATSVRYRWLAIGGEPAAPAPAQRGVAPNHPPRITLTVPRGRRWISRRRIALYARCDELCALSARAVLRVGASSRSATVRSRILAPGRRVRIVLRSSPALRRSARLAVRGRRRARFSFTATALDVFGHSGRASRRLVVRPAR